MTFTYRPADKKDSARLAELINIASDGVVEYLFHDLIPGMTPVQMVAHNLENDNYPHSYKRALRTVYSWTHWKSMLPIAGKASAHGL